MADYKRRGLDNKINDYDLIDKEILCELDLESSAKLLRLGVVPLSVLRKQRNFAKEASAAYESGGEDFTCDAIKADHFHQLAYGKPKFKFYANTQNIYLAFSKYTSVRLFILRLNRLLTALNHSFLKPLFSIAGFSYGLEFVIDSIEVLYTTFRTPLTPMEARLSHLQRFKNVLHKDNRISRMANSGLWFVINLLAFIFTGGVSSWLNVGGFIFDIGHEVIKSYKMLHRHTALAKKINDDLVDKITELRELKRKFSEPSLEFEQQKNKLQTDIRDLRLLQTSLNKKISSLTWRKVYDIVSSLVIVVGVLLVFFPPTSAIGIPIVGAGLAFAAGSVFNGLGRMLATSAFNFIKRCASPPKKHVFAQLFEEDDHNYNEFIPTPKNEKHSKYRSSYLSDCQPLLAIDDRHSSPMTTPSAGNMDRGDNYHIATLRRRASTPVKKKDVDSTFYLPKFSVLRKHKLRHSSVIKPWNVKKLRHS